MSQLAQVRRQASSIHTFMRQGKYMAAVQALRDAVLTMIRQPLMKQEREEFERLISDGIHHVMADPELRKSAALELKYVPGQERALLDDLAMLLEVFEEDMREVAAGAAEALRLAEEEREARRREELARGQALLDADDVAGARVVFADLADEAEGDSEIRADIGTRFLNARQYEDAAAYLQDAVTLSPHAAHTYNSLAMALRKLGKYADAEQCYLKAAQNGYKDSHLFFNMGRLYVDWERWDKAVAAAGGALTLDPNFAEARKLMQYAEKKLKG